MKNFKQNQVSKTRINIRNCVFGFRCAQNWDAMQETSREGVRFCKECAKDVFWVTSKENLMEAITLNRCVAIDALVNPEPAIDKQPEVLLGMIRNYEETYGDPEPNAEFRKRLRNKKII